MLRRSCLIGMGHSLPNRVVENSEFENWIETSDEWIEARSGIKRRHFADPEQKTSNLAIEAARAAIKDADIEVFGEVEYSGSDGANGDRDADGSCEFDGSSVCGGGDGDGDCEHLT